MLNYINICNNTILLYFFDISNQKFTHKNVEASKAVCLALSTS